ncbi:hypothetical protein [Streptomyces sp. NPDC093060]|uniref:hypothetical protein n=1 Tax=Streptomyces sp. NPDC093060 TaxID=3366019 RepID=UPI0038036E6E
MAWDEWEQLKTAAAKKHSAGMQLNHLPDAGGGGGSGAGDLVVHQDDLGAVGHEAFILHDRLSKQGDIAAAGSGQGSEGSTMQAAAVLKSHNFTTASVMELAVDLWTSRTKTLLQACADISNHLDFTKKQHAQDDDQIAASLLNRDGSGVSASVLNEYFK